MPTNPGTWLWATNAGSQDYIDSGMSILPLSDNSAIVAGYFGGSASFGNLTALIPNGGEGYDDIFVAKINSSGTWQWAVKANINLGSNAYPDMIKLSISKISDESGFYLTSNFSGTITIGSTTLISTGSSDIFVAKIDSTGNWIWATKAGGILGDKGISIDTLSDNSAMVVGYFGSTATFGNLPNLVQTGTYDLFVAKINSSGNWVWAIDFYSTYDDQNYLYLPNSIKILSDNSAIITGGFLFNITFNNTISLTSNGQALFVAKIDTSGNWQWARKAESITSYENRGQAISVLSDNSVFVTGLIMPYDQSTTFFNVDSNNIVIPATGIFSGYYDIFVAKINSSGVWQWATKAGGINNGSDDRSFSIATSLNDSGIITGYFQTATFGNTTLTSVGGIDIFVAKIDSSGNWIWASQAGGNFDDYGGQSICCLSDGSAVITGSFSYQATFGNITLNSGTMSINGNIFVAKIYVGGYADVNTYFSEKLSDNSIINVGTFTDGSMIFDTDPDTILINDSSNNKLFISKMDSDGDWIWAKQNTGEGSIYINEMTKFIVNSDNSIVIGGKFGENSIIFNTTLSLGSKTIGSYNTIFIANINSSGDWQWAISSGGTADCILYHIIKVSDGYIVSGIFKNGTLILGTTTLSTTNKTDLTYHNIFIAKLNLSGDTWLWASQCTGTGNDYVSSIEVLSNGKIIVIGTYNNGTMVFPTQSTTTLSVNSTNSTYNNIFVTLLDSSGNFQWAKQTTGTGSPSINNNLISILNDDSCIFSGNYDIGTLIFALTTPVTLTSTATSQGDKNIFMAKIDSSGNWVWARQSGGTGNAIINVHSELSDNYAVIAGTISSGTSFFNGDSSRTTVTSNLTDLYITKTYTNDNTSGTHLRQICSSVLSEGGYEKNSILKSIGTNSSTTMITTDLSGNVITAGTTLYACAIRIRTDANGNLYNTIAIPNELLIYLNTKPSTTLENPVIEYRLVLTESNSIIPSTSWITYSTNSGIQYMTFPNITGLTVLEVVKSGILEGKTIVDLSDMGDFILQLGRKITGKSSDLLTYDSYAFVLILYCINIPTGTGGSTTFGNISFKLGWNEI